MKAGILGGGQLGRMLLQAAANYDVETFVMESNDDCPAAHLAHHFIKGNINNYDDVYAFGKMVDVLTIEIEHVNIDALEMLEKEGVKVYPNTVALRTIKNKITQKQFYQQHGITTSEFRIVQSKEEIDSCRYMLPAVLKLGEGGYDGRGVMMLNDESDLHNAFNKPCVLEKKIRVKHELACIVAVDNQLNHSNYPPVEMFFDASLNLLDFQLCPSQLDSSIINNAIALAVKTASAFRSPGIFAVELFVDEDDHVWVNETAPRVHNSGHHTIEASYCSQFDMLWRILLSFPLGNTDNMMASALVNLVGDAWYRGPAEYQGVNDVLALRNIFLHLYGKKLTQPGRKMGHVNVLGNDVQRLMETVQIIKSTLKVIGKNKSNDE